MKRGMKVKVPVQDAWVGWAGSLPPPPAPLAELLGGRGGGMAGGSCLGILSGEGGISGKQAASGNGGFFRQVNRRVLVAGESSRLPWQIFLAG
jgi:hypothetical protein